LHHFEKFQSKGENLPKTKTLPLYPHWAMTCTFVSSPSHFHRIQWSKEPNKPEGLFFDLPVKHLTKAKRDAEQVFLG
jgi:hypothetical protein